MILDTLLLLLVIGLPVALIAYFAIYFYRFFTTRRQISLQSYVIYRHHHLRNDLDSVGMRRLQEALGLGDDEAKQLTHPEWFMGYVKDSIFRGSYPTKFYSAKMLNDLYALSINEDYIQAEFSRFNEASAALFCREYLENIKYHRLKSIQLKKMIDSVSPQGNIPATPNPPTPEEISFEEKVARVKTLHEYMEKIQTSTKKMP